MQDIIDLEISQTIETFTKIQNDTILQQNIITIANKCIDALKSGNKILFCGNGGSAADCQHLAAELTGRMNYDRPGLAGIALTVDTSALTCISNDYGYDNVFSRQVEAIGSQGDILIGFSTSGKSRNVLEAFKSAKKKNIVCIAFLGQNDNDIGAIADFKINIPSHRTPKVQEAHISIGHIVCGLIESGMFPKA